MAFSPLGVLAIGLEGASLLVESPARVLRERDDWWWEAERREGGAPIADDSTSPSYVGESTPSLSGSIAAPCTFCACGERD